MTNQIENILVVDDEEDARGLVLKLIETICLHNPEIRQASNVEAASAILKSWEPDVLFLDIQLEGGSGFDLLDGLIGRPINVIFTTSFDNYAIKAFKYSAIDYLLKPIDPDDFKRAINKVKTKIQDERLAHLVKLLKQPSLEKDIDRIALPTSEGITYLDLKDIVRIEADKSYSTFYSIQGDICLVSNAIGEYEALLPTAQFFRIHASHLINLNFVKRFVKLDGGSVILTDGTELPIARRRKEEFLGRIEALRV